MRRVGVDNGRGIVQTLRGQLRGQYAERGESEAGPAEGEAGLPEVVCSGDRKSVV